MDNRDAVRIIIVATVLLVAVGALVYWWAPTNESQFADAATMLAFAGAVAVGIERSIEMGWTIVGALNTSFWPLNAVSGHVQKMVNELDRSLNSLHEQATTATQQLEDIINKVAGPDGSTTDEVAEASKKAKAAERAEVIAQFTNVYTDFRANFDTLKEARDPLRLKVLTSIAQHEVDSLQGKAQDLNLGVAADAAQEAINGLQNFLASFKDNPGRRLISLYVAAIAGLAVAGLFGLDLFTAVLEPATADEVSSSPLTANPALNVVLTGIILGLGASPTHEVIRVLQEYKERQKGGNALVPRSPTREDQ